RPEKLSVLCPEIDLISNGSDRIAQDHLIRIFLRQPFCKSLPSVSVVVAAIDAKLAVTGVALSIGIERHDEDGSVISNGQAKTEIRWQAVFDLLPRFCTVTASVNSVMILQKEGILLFRMASDLVDALAEFRILIRKKICLHSGIGHLPFLSAVGGLINAAGRDGDLDIVRILFIGDNSMNRAPTETGRPLLSMWMIPQSAIQRPRIAGVL